MQFLNWLEQNHLIKYRKISWFRLMTSLAVGGIAGFFLMGIVVLIIYFAYPAFEYSLAIGSILIIIGLVTVIQLKLVNKLWKNHFINALST